MELSATLKFTSDRYNAPLRVQIYQKRTLIIYITNKTSYSLIETYHPASNVYRKY